MGGSSGKLRNVKNENPVTTWQIQGDLGSGTYGKVHLVRNRLTGQSAASKIAPISSPGQLQDFATEVDILTSCRHDNITNFVDGFYHNNDLWIIIELCDGGSLASIISKGGKPFDEAPLGVICHQMTTALDFLHQNRVIHRDLNASNTLVTLHGTVKIADFGVSALGKSDTLKRSTFVGSPHWMAPEVVSCEKNPTKVYTYTADIWSLGVTMIELADGRPPYQDLHPIKVLFKIMSAAPPSVVEPDKWSESFISFLRAALVKDPTRRSPAAELAQHSFCQTHTDKQALAAFVQAALS